MSVDHKHISPLFQLIVFCVALVPLLFFLYGTVQHFHAHDKRPHLAEYTPDTSRKKVTMGLYISDFIRLDTIKHKVAFTGIVWAEFNPKEITLDEIKDFSFDKGKITYKSDPVIEQRGAKTFVRWTVRVRLHIDFNYRAFPLDNHQLCIILANDSLDASLVQFVSADENFIIANSARLPSWKIIGKHVNVGHSCAQLQEDMVNKSVCAPRVLFLVDCAKNDLRHLFSIILPLLLIFFLTLFSFSFEVERRFDTLISISFGGITALLAYRFVIETLAPDVGYFMLSDYLFILFLVAVFAIFFFNTTILHLSQHTKKIAICLLHAFVVGGCGALFYWTLMI